MPHTATRQVYEPPKPLGVRLPSRPGPPQAARWGERRQDERYRRETGTELPAQCPFQIDRERAERITKMSPDNKTDPELIDWFGGITIAIAAASLFLAVVSAIF